MIIADILTSDRVRHMEDLSSKKRVIEELSNILAAGGHALREIDVFSCLINRERLGSTGLGEGVAIPHGRMAGLDETIGAFVRLSSAVEYEASDEKPVDLVFGMLVPEDATDEHLKTLAAIAEMFQDEAFRETLRNNTEAEKLFETIANYSPDQPD